MVFDKSLVFAFSLIEILIVVSILSILAAIAIPNMMNARLRVEVARVNADLNGCAIAIEQYAIDYGKYPYYNNEADEVSALSAASITYLPVTLTTPNGYLTQLPFDPFPPSYYSGSDVESKPHHYKYVHGYDQIYLNQQFIGSHIQLHFQHYSGSHGAVLWQVWSLGPDRVVAHDGIQYHSSNGLLSYGDLSRFGP